ncbi:restriction endonuclease subunit S [uncultured Brachyspira sp.]|uniref:restriction endonuclease subunit S n=1 Tax=uncultured Brachyspira sp. TaxID=221953 RepID=UPI0025835002|nr:restriction endonuclease subunit S [uncultured Brachyspira sp.]
MGLKVYNIDFSQFSKDKLLRCNYKTSITGINIENDIKTSKYNFFKLGEYFDIFSGFAFKSDDYIEDGIPVIRISNISDNFNINNMVFVPDEYLDKYSNFVLKKNDILVSLTGDGKLKTDLVFEDNKYLLNQRVGCLRSIKEVNILFFYYIINYYNLVDKQFYWFSNGKTQLNISPFDFLNIKIPLIDKQKQDEIVSLIEPIENKIKSLKETIIPEQKIINEVFANKFNFDLRELETANKPFYVDLNTIDTPLLRMTTIQNKPLSIKLKNIMRNNSIFLKSILTKRIIRGKQPIYEDDGIKVIKTMNIQKGNIIFDDVQFVSEDFFNLNKDRAICKNDLLLTSTGMGRGKFAIYKYDEPCFADSHISIIRFDTNKMIPSYLNYFCQSFFGSMQLKYIEMHIKGTPEIYEAQLNYFCIFNLDVNKQQEIVDEIDNKIKEQQKINIQIEKERNKIYDIINSYIN